MRQRLESMVSAMGTADDVSKLIRELREHQS